MAIKNFDEILAVHAKKVDLLLKLAVEARTQDNNELFKHEYKEELKTFKRMTGNLASFVDSEMEKRGL